MTEPYVYFVEFSKIGDRLDYVAYNPEKIQFFNELKKKGAIPLNAFGNLIDDTIDPKDKPGTEYLYIGLDDIEPNTGILHPNLLKGKDILSKAKVIKKNDLVFSRLRPYLNKVYLAKEDCIGTTELYVFRVSDEIKREYLFRYLRSSLTLEQTKWALTGSSLPRLDEIDFLNLLIIVPDNLKEILYKTNSMETKINELLKEIRDSLDKVLSSFYRYNSLQIPLNEVDYYIVEPNNVTSRLDFIWHNPSILLFLKKLESLGTVNLGELVEDDIAYGVNDYGKDEGKIPFINIENLNFDGRIHSETIRYLNSVSQDKLVKENDLLISRSRGAGICGLVSKQEEGFTFGSYILRLRLRKGISIDPLYLTYFINSPIGQIQVRRLETGSSGSNINPEQLKHIKILLNGNTKKLIENIRDYVKHREELETKSGEMNKKNNELFEKLVLD